MLLDLLSPITNLVNTLADELSAGDGVAKGLISVAIMGGLAAAFRKVPGFLGREFLKMVTVSIRVDEEYRTEDKRLYWRVSEFITENVLSKNMRIFNPLVRGNGQNKDVTFNKGPQPGSGFFIKGFRLFWYTYDQGREMGAVPESITITTFGKSEDKFLRLLKVKEAVLDSNSIRYYKENGKEGWTDISEIETTAPVFLAPWVKETLDKKINEFIESADWCHSRGLSHKLLIIAHGEPGTGKSSIARYVAEKIGYSLGTMRGIGDFTKDMRTAASDSIVVSVPDFDAMSIANNRGDEEGEDKPSSSSKAEKVMTDFLSGAILSEVLNLFEGDVPIHNLVCVMSTNKIGDIDPALYRGSRCDLLIELPALTYDEINQFQKFYYNRTEDINEELKDIELVASDVMAIFRNNRNDYDGFILGLIEKVAIEPAEGSFAKVFADLLKAMKLDKVKG